MSRKDRNWANYNAKLINRGRITLWVDEEVLANPLIRSGKKGRPKMSDRLLLTGMCLRAVYGLSLRALQGFMTDLFKLLSVDCPVPHYSLYSKRMATIELPQISSKRPSHILVDASGVKVYGEGEWKVKVHGADKRRKWVKMHVAVDASTQEIVAVETTDSSVGDSTMLEPLLESCAGKPKKVTADGAYDGLPCREYLHSRGIEDMIMPPSNAVLRKEEAMENRNRILAIITGFGGDSVAKKLAKKLLGYHRRSLVETCFSRLKRLFGERFASRKYENICVESKLKCWILNRMAA